MALCLKAKLFFNFKPEQVSLAVLKRQSWIIMLKVLHSEKIGRNPTFPNFI